jgi:simple sugar transport system permease protein
VLFRACFSIFASLLVSSLIIHLSGYGALAAISAWLTGATGVGWDPPTAGGTGALQFSPFLLAQSLAKVTPLLFIGLAVSVAFRAGLFNVGATGQMTVGALAAAVVGALGKADRGGGGGSHLPPAVHTVLVLAAAACAGAVWAWIAGMLKVRRGVQEVISTILLNYVAINFADYLVMHNLQDPATMTSQTVEIAPAVRLGPWVPGSDLTAGFLIAMCLAGGIGFLLRHTVFGYELRAVGLNPEAARTAGIDVDSTRMKAMMLSGGIAGLAGAILVMGVYHRFVSGLASTYGFDGIAVAMLGYSSATGVFAAALFLGALISGASSMQQQTDVPSTLVVIVQGMVVISMGLRFRFGGGLPQFLRDATSRRRRGV